MSKARIGIEFGDDGNARVDVQGVLSIQEVSVALGKTMGFILKNRELSDGGVELAFATMAQAAFEVLGGELDEERFKRLAMDGISDV